MLNLSRRFLNTIGQYSLNLKWLGMFSLQRKRHPFIQVLQLRRKVSGLMVSITKVMPLALIELHHRKVCGRREGRGSSDAQPPSTQDA